MKTEVQIECQIWVFACCLTATASQAAVLTGQFRPIMPKTGPKSKTCGWLVGSLLTNSNCFEDTFLPCQKGNTILVWKTGLLKKMTGLQGRSLHLGDSSFCLGYLERVFLLSKGLWTFTSNMETPSPALPTLLVYWWSVSGCYVTEELWNL